MGITYTNKQWTTYRILDQTIDNVDLADPLNIGATGVGKGFTLWADTSGYRVDWDEAGDGGKGSFEFGADQYGVDFILYGQTTGERITWDASAGSLTFDVADLKLGDNDYLQFGDGAGGDVSARWVSATSLLEILPLTDNVGAIHIGNGTKDIDLKIFLGETTQTVEFDVSAGIVRFGYAGNGVDVVFYGDTSADSFMFWDESADSLIFRTGSKALLYEECTLTFGNNAGVARISMEWHTDGYFHVTQGVTNSLIRWGIDGAGIDQQWYGDTPDAFLVWDQSADLLEFRGGASIRMQDDCYVKFGDEDDITIRWDASQLRVAQATANSMIRWGVDGAGIDQQWYGDTPDAFMLWDQSADSLVFRTGTNLVMYQDCQLRFASNAGATNMTMEWDSGGLFYILPGTDNNILSIGNGTLNCDLWIFGADNDSMIIWDCEEDTHGAWHFGVSAGYGVNVNFYGKTAGNSMAWDASASTLDLVSTLPTATGTTADNAQTITVTDASTTSGNINRGLYISYTQSGAKTTTAEVNGLGIDVTTSADVPTLYAISLYTAFSSSPTIDYVGGYYLYMAATGSATVNYKYGLMLEIDNTNAATVRDAFIYLYRHGSNDLDSIIRCERALGTATNLISFQGENGAPCEVNASDSSTRSHRIKVLCGTTTGYLSVFTS